MHVWVIPSALVQVVDQLVVFIMESKSHCDVILQRLVFPLSKHWFAAPLALEMIEPIHFVVERLKVRAVAA